MCSQAQEHEAVPIWAAAWVEKETSGKEGGPCQDRLLCHGKKFTFLPDVCQCISHEGLKIGK